MSPLESKLILGPIFMIMGGRVMDGVLFRNVLFFLINRGISGAISHPFFSIFWGEVHDWER